MIEIGTNFSYKGPRFLDERHGLAGSKNDLRDWSIPIPEGFEVFLNDVNSDEGPAWYTYSSSNEYDEFTGKFKKRIDETWVDNAIRIKTNLINDRIDNLQWQVNDLQYEPDFTLNVTPCYSYNSIIIVPDLTPDGNVMIAPAESPQIIPIIRWTLKNYNSNINISNISEMSVNDISVEPITSEWVGSYTINSTREYTLTVTYNNQTFTHTFRYIFSPYDWTRYFGVYRNQTINSINDLIVRDMVSGWGNTEEVISFEGSVNCLIGGSDPSYPYYIIPVSAFVGRTLNVYVGGLRTTDYEIQNLSIDGVSYKAIRTGYIQTGVLQMKYELRADR